MYHRKLVVNPKNYSRMSTEKLKATDSSFERRLRYLSGRDCSSALYNPGSFSSQTPQTIITFKEICFNADHPGLTSTFSSLWTSDPIESSSSYSFTRMSKDRASKIL